MNGDKAASPVLVELHDIAIILMRVHSDVGTARRVLKLREILTPDNTENTVPVVTQLTREQLQTTSDAAEIASRMTFVKLPTRDITDGPVSP